MSQIFRMMLWDEETSSRYGALDGGVLVLENMHKIRPKRPEIDTKIDYLHLREYLKS